MHYFLTTQQESTIEPTEGAAMVPGPLEVIRLGARGGRVVGAVGNGISVTHKWCAFIGNRGT